MNNLLVLDNLSVGYKDLTIYKDLSFNIAENTITSILCPNNSGKSTLIKTLSGINCGLCGSIVLNNVKLTKRSFKKYIRDVGVVLEDIDRQFITNNVKDEIIFPLVNLGYNKSVIDKHIEDITKICELDNILNKKIDSLSNYDKIKVLIASSIIHFPKILLLDDPFRFLNLKEQKKILNILNNIKNNCNISIIFTTSQFSSIIDLDNIIVLGNGKIIMQGNYKDIIKKDNELSKLGIEIPIMIDLSLKLQFYNLLDDICYDVGGIVDKLWK